MGFHAQYLCRHDKGHEVWGVIDDDGRRVCGTHRSQQAAAEFAEYLDGNSPPAVAYMS